MTQSQHFVTLIDPRESAGGICVAGMEPRQDFGDRTTRQASLRAGRSTPRRPPSTLAPSAEGASDHARQRQAVGDFDRRGVVRLGGLVRWRHSEDPDHPVRHRLEGGGRAWRILPGDRHRHLSTLRPRCRIAPGRAAGQPRATPRRRPARFQHRHQLLCSAQFRARKHPDGRGCRDVPKGPVGADRASGAGR